MIAIDCRVSSPGPHDVFVNGKKDPLSGIFAVWALWNGGPGIVGYYPMTDGGHTYVNHEGDDMARAYRLSWSVRIAPRAA